MSWNIVRDFRSWLRGGRDSRRQVVATRRLRYFRLSVEGLEDRTAPATFTVTTADDDPTKTTNVRWAIGQANTTALGVDERHVIRFEIGEATQTITIGNTALPAIEKPTVIDGSYTKAGQSNQTITLKAGANTPNDAAGLEFKKTATDDSSGSKVWGLRIEGV